MDNSGNSVSAQITDPIEIFEPEVTNFDGITLIDCMDSFTHNLVQTFLSLGAPVTVVKSHQVSITQLNKYIKQYIVISPGPGEPKDAGIAKVVYDKYRGKLPILGVCLGMQCINEVLGGKTVSAPIPVHGKISNIHHNGTSIFQSISSPTPVARYHSLMIEVIDDNLDILSSVEDVIMSFKVKNEPTVAVQFHPESFLTTEGVKMISNFLEGNF